MWWWSCVIWAVPFGHIRPSPALPFPPICGCFIAAVVHKIMFNISVTALLRLFLCYVLIQRTLSSSHPSYIIRAARYVLVVAQLAWILAYFFNLCLSLLHLLCIVP